LISSKTVRRIECCGYTDLHVYQCIYLIIFFTLLNVDQCIYTILFITMWYIYISLFAYFYPLLCVTRKSVYLHHSIILPVLNVDLCIYTILFFVDALISSKTVRRIECCGYTDLHVTQSLEYNSVDTLTYMQHIVKSRIM
jgi:hypothetical protein